MNQVSVSLCMCVSQFSQLSETQIETAALQTVCFVAYIYTFSVKELDESLNAYKASNLYCFEYPIVNKLQLSKLLLNIHI